MEKKKWNITKSVYNKSKSFKSKTASDFLLDLFVCLLTQDSSEQYKSAANAFDTDAFKKDAEKNFLEILPKLIVQGRDDDIIKLIRLIRSSAYQYEWGTKRSYETYLMNYVDFLEKFVTSTSKKYKPEIIKKIKQFTLSPLTDEEEQYLSDAFACQVFLHDKLQTKFKARLRRQDRTSGDKIWLPLSFIAKIFKENDRSSDFSMWLDKLVDGIYIHYKDDTGTFASVSFKSNVFLVFEKREDGEYDVFVIWSKGKKPKKHRVYTPTGKGNEKVPMKVRDISEIDIDHIKPIDRTLRELDEKNKLKTLKIVSDAYKQLLEDITKQEKDEDESKIKSKDLEKQTIERINNNDSFCIDKLLKDLERIRKDGLLRLMDASYNEQKSNGITFEGGFRQDGNNYIGILGTALLDDNSEEITIYQKLEENGITRATSSDNLKGVPVKLSKDMINLL